MHRPKKSEVNISLLKFAADRVEHSNREAYDYIADQFRVPTAERKRATPGYPEPYIVKRVRWQLYELRAKGFLEATRPSVFRITDAGVEYVKRNNIQYAKGHKNSSVEHFYLAKLTSSITYFVKDKKGFCQ